MSVSIFSYRGEITVGLMVDAARIPDPDRILSELERELQALRRLGGRAPRRRAARRRETARPRS
jgi:3-deoxy-D-arabino-heptulosonate 7-phosphate (DAHP) synthase class II